MTIGVGALATFIGVINRIGIGTAKEKRRPFECHPIVIGTVKVDLRQVTCLHEQDVGYMTIFQLNQFNHR